MSNTEVAITVDVKYLFISFNFLFKASLCFQIVYTFIQAGACFLCVICQTAGLRDTSIIAPSVKLA